MADDASVVAWLTEVLLFEFVSFMRWLLSPVAAAVLCCVLGSVLCAWHRRGWGLAIMFVGTALLVVTSMPIVAHALVGPLERQFPAVLAAEHPVADAIVVLGGALSGAQPPERPVFDLGPAADRVWFAAALYKAGKAPWVLVAGGSRHPVAGRQAEGKAIRAMLVTLGVPRDAIHIETRSRNTRENAQETAGLIAAVDARRVLLVTSAMHMPRAMRTFRKVLQGTAVELLPASTDVVATSIIAPGIWGWLPNAEALALSSRAIKEYLGQWALAFSWR